MEFVDITDWPDDDEYESAYPEGARPKRTLFSPLSPTQKYIKPNWRHMFKRSAGRYPEQFWAEIIAYEVSRMLGIPVPPCYPAVDRTTGQCGALIEWFYKDGVESFYSAGNFFHKIIENFDRDKGTQHNLIDADTFNNKVLGKNSIYSFWSMMLFDCVIGNTDRHQDNWGYLLHAVELPKSVARRRGERFEVKWKFAPWFDNGTSLGHELLPGKFTRWDEGALTRYILRGQHHLRLARDNLQRMGHMASLKFISEAHRDVAKLLIKRLRGFDSATLRASLNAMVDIEAPPGGSLTKDRADFIHLLTVKRVNMAMEILNERN